MDIDRVLDIAARLWPALPLAVVGAGLCGASVALNWQWQHRQELVQLRATIVQIRAEAGSKSSSGGPTWWVKALCDYTWAGERHQGKEVALTGGSVSSQREMEALLVAHPAGSSLPLWIHPQTPASPLVVLPTRTQVFVLAGIGAVFLAIAAALFLHSD